ncbi:MAG: hypothetical protein ACK2TV_01020, partial [Anaerolineales bacterium]
WVEIVTAAFQSGIYNRQTEITIFNERLNLHTKNPPAFHTKYPLILLSSQRSQLDPQLERLILADVMSRSDGIYYLYSSLLSEMPAISDRKFYYWLETQKILARFPTWFRHADSFILDILAQRNAEGLWSFSKRVPRQPYSPLPISESWRKKANKSIDCSVLVLQLLSQYFQQAGKSAEA